MRVSFDFLPAPLCLANDKINVLCIENKELYRNIIRSFMNDEPEEMNVVFSENFVPFNFKGHGCCVYDFYHLKFSTSIMKKMYEQIELFCTEELYNDISALKTAIVGFLELIVQNFDYDFVYDTEVNLSEIFKIQDLQPDMSGENLLRNILDFTLLINKYVKPKCFVFMNLHLYFDSDELKEFYKEMGYNHVKLILIENAKNFEKQDMESVTVVDKDMCVMLENDI